jgi:hypothetical protein
MLAPEFGFILTFPELLFPVSVRFDAESGSDFELYGSLFSVVRVGLASDNRVKAFSFSFSFSYFYSDSYYFSCSFILTFSASTGCSPV